jgi:hypothetical protein
MACQETLYDAEVLLVKLSKRYAYLVSHGMCADSERKKIEEINFLRTLITNYKETSDLSIKDGELILNCNKVILSEKNNYFCKEDDQMISVLDQFENCLSEDDYSKCCNRLAVLVNC